MQWDPQANVRLDSPKQLQPRVWIQYKGPRARVLQTTKLHKRTDALVAKILEDFQHDMQALSINIYGLQMGDVRIIWGTGQIRAVYPIHGKDACETVQYILKRATMNPFNKLSDRSISSILYTDGGPAIDAEDLPDIQLRSLSSSKGPGSHTLKNSPVAVDSQDGRPSLRSLSIREPRDLPLREKLSQRELWSSSVLDPPTQPAPNHVASSSRRNDAPETSEVFSPSSSRAFHASRPPSGRQPPHSFATAERHQALPVSSSSSYPATPQLYPQTAPQILPPIYLGRRDTHVDTPLPSQACHSPTNSKTWNAVEQSSVREAQSAISRMESARTLTAGACRRIRDRSDHAVVDSAPMVRVLVLRQGKRASTSSTRAITAYESYITDGAGYAWIAFSSSVSAYIGDRDDSGSLQVGSDVRLTKMSRLSSSPSCPILVHAFEIMSAATATSKPAVPSGLSVTHTDKPPQRDALYSDESSSGNTAWMEERAIRLQTETKLQQERQSRIVLEGILANVCKDLDAARSSLGPELVEVLRKLDELAETAMVVH